MVGSARHRSPRVAGRCLADCRRALGVMWEVNEIDHITFNCILTIRPKSRSSSRSVSIFQLVIMVWLKGQVIRPVGSNAAAGRRFQWVRRRVWLPPLGKDEAERSRVQPRERRAAMMKMSSPVWFHTAVPRTW